MKKFTKITALAVAIIMLCLSLSGCAELDLMREEQCFWTNEKGIDSITTSDGETYVLLDNEVANLIMYDTYLWENVWVTAKDVPVLLSSTYGVGLLMTSDKDFVYGYIQGKTDDDGVFRVVDSNVTSVSTPFSLLGSAFYFTETSSSTPFSLLRPAFYFTETSVHHDKIEERDVTYCKESIYDDIMSQVENGIEYTHYGYEYYVYDEEYMEVPKNYYLNSDESDLIEKILKEVKPKAETQELYDKYYSLCELYHYSDDRNFGEYTFEVFASENYDEYIFGVYIESLDAYDCYEVPEKYLDDVKKIFKNAEESNELMWVDDVEIYE